MGTRTHGTDVWYRCNGYLRYRGPIEGKCTSKAIKGEHIEPPVWVDIENWLRDPGGVLEELRSEATGRPSEVILDAERITLEAALREQAGERERILYLFQHDHIKADELEERLGKVAATTETLERRLSALGPDEAEPIEPIEEDLLCRLRERLDQGLSDEERVEIVRLLVRRITVFTEPLDEGKKMLRAVVEYRFPEVKVAVVNTPPAPALPRTTRNGAAEPAS